MDYTKDEVIDALDEIGWAQIDERQVGNDYYSIIYDLYEYLDENNKPAGINKGTYDTEPIIRTLSVALDSIENEEPIVGEDVCDCSGLDELIEWDEVDWLKD